MAYKEVEIVEEDGRRVTRKRSEGGKAAAKTGGLVSRFSTK